MVRGKDHLLTFLPLKEQSCSAPIPCNESRDQYRARKKSQNELTNTTVAALSLSTSDEQEGCSEDGSFCDHFQRAGYGIREEKGEDNILAHLSTLLYVGRWETPSL
jgi:hypothetical protein